MEIQTSNYEVPPDAIFLIGAPSEGCFGQLAIDCMIATLYSASDIAIKRVGYIESDSVPVVSGYETFGSTRLLCLPIEVYAVCRPKEVDVIIIQQRVPCLPGMALEWARSLLGCLQEKRFSYAFVLTGAFLPDDDNTSRVPDFVMGRRMLQEIVGFDSIKNFQYTKVSAASLSRSHGENSDPGIDGELVAGSVGAYMEDAATPRGMTAARALLFAEAAKSTACVFALGRFFPDDGRPGVGGWGHRLAAKKLAALLLKDLFGLGVYGAAIAEPKSWAAVLAGPDVNERNNIFV